MSYPTCKCMQTVKCHAVFSVKGKEQLGLALCSFHQHHICSLTLIRFFLPSFL